MPAKRDFALHRLFSRKQLFPFANAALQSRQLDLAAHCALGEKMNLPKCAKCGAGMRHMGSERSKNLLIVRTYCCDPCSETVVVTDDTKH
jgi:hypothetical protein